MRWRSVPKRTRVGLGTVALWILLIGFVGIWDRCFHGTGLGGSKRQFPAASSSSSSSSSPSSFAVVINTFRRPERLKRAVQHYAETCGRRYSVGQVFVVWADQANEPPPDAFFWGNDDPPQPLRATPDRELSEPTKTKTTGSDIDIDIDNETNNNRVPVTVLKKDKDSLNARFEPIPQLRTTSIFMVDDDIRVSCVSLHEAFSAWKEQPDAMVGFYPRLAVPSARQQQQQQQHDPANPSIPIPEPQFVYHLWPKIYWKQKFNIVLTKASFLHSKYLELYSNDDSFPKEIKDHVDKHKNCEDIAMSILVANYTQYNDHKNHKQKTTSPVLYVAGSVSDAGLFGGISSGQGHFATRSDCLNRLTQIVRSRGFGSPLERDFALAENSWIRHSPGFWWQPSPSNPSEWLGLANLFS
eukprot:jgi/Psemu1/195108/e_gw1.167.29.1